MDAEQVYLFSFGPFCHEHQLAPNDYTGGHYCRGTLGQPLGSERMSLEDFTAMIGVEEVSTQNLALHREA